MDKSPLSNPKIGAMEDRGFQLDESITRTLKRGDLVKVKSEKRGKLKDHCGEVGRIVRAREVGPTLENSHPYVYDVDLVLGGKLSEVFRADLLYTTASQEGMIGDSRSRRKRKPNAAPDANLLTEETKKPKGKVGRKKKGATKKPPAKKAASKKSSSTSKSTTGKKRAAGEKTKGNSKKSRNNPGDDVGSSTTAPTSQAMDMYERQRREFERSLLRLEKADVYNFFGTEVPSEFEECYDGAKGTDGANGRMPDKSDDNNHFTSPVTSAQHSSISSESQSPLSVGSSQINDNSKSTEFSKSNTSINSSGSQEAEKTIHFPSQAPYNFVVIRQRMKHGRYVLDRVRLENEQRMNLLRPYFKSIGRKNLHRRPKKSAIPVLHCKSIDWDLFRKDVVGMCDAALDRNPDFGDVGAGSLKHAVGKIKDLLDQIYEKIGRRHTLEISAANHRHRFSLAMDKTLNAEAAMQGKWKRDAFPERKYERLKEDAVCAGLSELDERIATYELKTTLKDAFIGLAYTYDDTGQSEGWMKSVLDVAGEQTERRKTALALAADDGVIKAQVNASMQSLLIGVQDKVMTETGVLEQRELRSANWEEGTEKVAEQVIPTKGIGSASGPEIVEQPVWGIDCYTRRNISICLETEFDSDTVLTFIEKWLLPAINACPADLASEISNAARILEGLPFDASTSVEGEKGTTSDQWRTTLLGRSLLDKIATSGPVWLKAAAYLLRLARDNLGPDFFRVHPKGHGSIVLCEKLEPNRLVTFYRGEVYPSWRWGEKTDAIADIQARKGLKPVLPDFFNMALERPQNDPRGYGLLFVDASRKSGYGSMLSHSCEPSCEVRVVAVNGELRLAMTTLREMTVGDELTFDYNAVTESLIEYQSAVCLCGHGRCKGAFLHFATADCYQQVLNRNSPIAVRLANLVKGSTKKVLSDDDDRILKRHGLQTAAFGAISVNRRKVDALDVINPNLDSMSIVPVWLRTFVADTLRYIEYERRALPIALLCNDLFDESSTSNADIQRTASPTKVSEEDEESPYSSENDKPIKGSKPEPTFFYYARTKKDYFVSLLIADVENQKLAGIELKREVQKLASTHWKSLDPQQKENWKVKAVNDWEKNGGREKARLEEERLKRLSKGAKGSAKGSGSKKEKSIKCKPDRKKESSKPAQSPLEPKPKISFQQADAEGVQAMEQRIQQLTQTLSRVGRVLDRHREAILTSMDSSKSNILNSDDALREVVHSPLEILPDEHVVAWMWNHEEGVVRMLLKHAQNEVCVSPSLKNSLLDTFAKYEILQEFGRPWESNASSGVYPMTPVEGRAHLNTALLELRQNLLDGIQQMASSIKKQKADSKKESSRKKKAMEEAEAKRKKLVEKNSTRHEVQEVMEEIICKIESQFSADGEKSELDTKCNANTRLLNGVSRSESKDPESLLSTVELDPWLQNFNKRFKLEKAADLLLLHAKTGNFFSIKPFTRLESSPIEVYARELGNSVPVSAIDKTQNQGKESASILDQENHLHTSSNEPKKTTPKSRKLCDPEDIISNVVVKYQGDYVLSQLLQWYNAGIGQKAGLPDFLGCILLPSMKGCWTVDGTTVSNSHTDRATRYQSTTRRRLIDWFKDPLKRGNPWPDEIRRAFIDKDDDKLIHDSTSMWLPLGSPILDFLVTGDDQNMNSIVQTLSSFHSSSLSRRGKSTGDGLLSSVDEGRPAQAVSNWVQCENPSCQKWRKVPWNVDIDMLSKHFVCKDNVWNPQSASCDAAEDEWDETADAQVGADGAAIAIKPIAEVKDEAVDKKKKKKTLKLLDLKLGAKFDVLRAQKAWSVATVVKLDVGGNCKRVKVHYPKMQIKHDEWIEIDSSRIAPLYSKVARPVKKGKGASRKKSNSSVSSKEPKSKSSENGVDSAVLVKSAPDAQNLPNEISDDASAKSTFINTDDSSMADVFLQDSDEEEGDDDGSEELKIETAVVPSRTAFENTSSEVASESIEDILKDSEDDDDKNDNNDEVPLNMAERSNSSSRLKPKSCDRATRWTIPKKKVSPKKIKHFHNTDLASSASDRTQKENEIDNSEASTQCAKGTRIPRKKVSDEKHQPSLLLPMQTSPTKPPPSPFDRKRAPLPTSKEFRSQGNQYSGKNKAADDSSPSRRQSSDHRLDERAVETGQRHRVSHSDISPSKLHGSPSSIRSQSTQQSHRGRGNRIDRYPDCRTERIRYHEDERHGDTRADTTSAHDRRRREDATSHYRRHGNDYSRNGDIDYGNFAQHDEQDTDWRENGRKRHSYRYSGDYEDDRNIERYDRGARRGDNWGGNYADNVYSGYEANEGRRLKRCSDDHFNSNDDRTSERRRQDRYGGENYRDQYSDYERDSRENRRREPRHSSPGDGRQRFHYSQDYQENIEYRRGNRHEDNGDRWYRSAYSDSDEFYRNSYSNYGYDDREYYDNHHRDRYIDSSRRPRADDSRVRLDFRR